MGGGGGGDGHSTHYIKKISVCVEKATSNTNKWILCPQTSEVLRRLFFFYMLDKPLLGKKIDWQTSKHVHMVPQLTLNPLTANIFGFSFFISTLSTTF